MLRSLELAGFGLAAAPAASPLAGMPCLPRLRRLALSNCFLGSCLPACASQWTGLQELEVFHPQQAEADAWRGSLSSALQALPQLRGLWLEWNDYPGGTSPQAAAGLSRLEWLYWEPNGGGAALPPGPWQRSLRMLVTNYETAAASLPFLSGAQQLERLSLVNPPYKAGWTPDSAKARQWPAFWSWAAKHGPLRCLEFTPEPNYAEAPGTVQPEAVNAVASLAATRPGLHIECLPATDDPTLMYPQLLLPWWL